MQPEAQRQPGESGLLVQQQTECDSPGQGQMIACKRDILDMWNQGSACSSFKAPWVMPDQTDQLTDGQEYNDKELGQN
ncbi:MAG: hypothetical protein WBX11_16015 [Thiobacillaceae bacterium]